MTKLYPFVSELKERHQCCYQVSLSNSFHSFRSGPKPLTAKVYQPEIISNQIHHFRTGAKTDAKKPVKAAAAPPKAGTGRNVSKK